MRLALVTPVLNHRDETLRCLDSFRTYARDWDEIELIVVDNGSSLPVSEWGIEAALFIRNEVNVGVLPALEQAYRQATADYLFFTHNDVVMYEPEWDAKLVRALADAGNVGVAGLFGAKGLGTPDLYKTPYHIAQLGRRENVSGCWRMPAVHGYRPPRGEWERVAVLDGFSLIVKRTLVDDLGGFDLNLPPHHNYDNHTCLQSLDRGLVNIVVAADAYHHGGLTDVSEPWNEPFGKSKAEIHRDAHYPYFYEYWRPGKRRVALPVTVE